MSSPSSASTILMISHLYRVQMRYLIDLSGFRNQTKAVSGRLGWGEDGRGLSDSPQRAAHTGRPSLSFHGEC